MFSNLQEEESEYTTDDQSDDEAAPGRPKLVKPVFVRKQERDVSTGPRPGL